MLGVAEAGVTTSVESAGGGSRGENRGSPPLPKLGSPSEAAGAGAVATGEGLALLFACALLFPARYGSNPFSNSLTYRIEKTIDKASRTQKISYTY